ncbi:sodium/proton-translocating pyrophosphatase, partial [Patescibacteria group bacterium]|nr:sodium/proton-translocating pyrophosphatase [Patescibacteria group bacterium]
MIFIPIVVSIFSLVFAYFLANEVNKAPSGSGKMVEISGYIREGALAFLKRQYKAVGLVAVILFLLLCLVMNIRVGLGFLIGVIASASAGCVGMMISTKANVKVAQAARKGLAPALNLSFQAGSVTGILVVGLGLFCVSFLYFLTQDLMVLLALSFGGSLVSVFARLGGGIYTKAADVGADLVG